MAMPETALAHVETSALDTGYGPEDLARRLVAMKSALSLTQQFFREVMVEGQDYGKVPGTDKPTLLKPGAEKFCELYGFAPTIKVDEEKSWETGRYRARVTVTLARRHTGEVVADGVGEANTMEARYRFRWVPEWKARAEGIDTSGLRFRERENAKGKYREYRVENDDPWTLWNTVLKMAKKRALVDAVLSATRSSGIFTQDTEDLAEWIAGEEHPIQAPADKQANGNDDRTRAIKQLFAVLKGDPGDPKFGATNKGLSPKEAEALIDAAEEKAGKPLEEWTAQEVKALTDTLRKIPPEKLRERAQEQFARQAALEEMGEMEDVDFEHVAPIHGL